MMQQTKLSKKICMKGIFAAAKDSFTVLTTGTRTYNAGPTFFVTFISWYLFVIVSFSRTSTTICFGGTTIKGMPQLNCCHFQFPMCLCQICCLSHFLVLALFFFGWRTTVISIASSHLINKNVYIQIRCTVTQSCYMGYSVATIIFHSHSTIIWTSKSFQSVAVLFILLIMYISSIFVPRQH